MPHPVGAWAGGGTARITGHALAARGAPSAVRLGGASFTGVLVVAGISGLAELPFPVGTDASALSGWVAGMAGIGGGAPSAVGLGRAGSASGMSTTGIGCGAASVFPISAGARGCARGVPGHADISGGTPSAFSMGDAGRTTLIIVAAIQGTAHMPFPDIAGV